MRPLSVALFLLLGACADSPQGIYDTNGTAQVIYGEDTREDILETDPFKELADATAILINQDKLSAMGSSWIINAWTLGERYPLCENEKFQKQHILGFCSGVLIAPNKVLTAAHCLKEQTSCETTKFSFGWSAEKSQGHPASIPADNIYNCKKIEKFEYNIRRNLDYAIVELDREVRNATPVKVARDAEVNVKDQVLSLSYPLGLPLKKDTGSVLLNNEMVLRVAIDVFAAASGSPLFNFNQELVGILVRGHNDIHEDDIMAFRNKQLSCINFFRCDTGTCFGETFLKTSHIEF